MLSLRAHLMICGACFGLMIGLAIVGNTLQAYGILRPGPRLATAAMAVFFTLFLASGFSAVPVIVKLVLAGHQAIGNADAPIVRSLIANQTRIIWAMWIVMFLGMCLAVPAAVMDGMFGPEIPEKIRAMLIGNSKGTLVAAPGMNMDEVIRLSSLKIAGAAGQSMYSGEQVFDFRVAGSAIEFHRCRQFFISTSDKDRQRIEAINVTTSTDKMPRGRLEAANAALRALLASDGWLTGHEEYHTKEDQQLHGGVTRGEEGRTWLKGTTVLDIEQRRIDDPAPGEDASTAGQWIQFVELWERERYPGIERLVFAPPGKPATP